MINVYKTFSKTDCHLNEQDLHGMNSTTKKLFVFILGVALAVPMISCKKSDNPVPVEQTPKENFIPKQGAWLGIYTGERTIEETDRLVGTKAKIQLTFFNWNDDWTEVINKNISQGKLPLVNWEPFNIDFKDIVSGRLDSHIRNQARRARAVKTTFFLDFAAEMNEEEGWGGHDPALYITAFRHIHDVFVQEGADNVVWVWAPNNVNSANAPDAMTYYPGDAYVDWIGIDGYNWGTSESGYQWESFYEVFRDMYTKVAAKGKPVMIAEMASDEKGGDKAIWIDQVVPVLKQKFPLIKAVIWFNLKKERNWPVESTARSLDAFKMMAADPYFNPAK